MYSLCAELSLFKIFRISIIVVALFLLSGGHWAVLQSIAWVQMIEGYSAQGSFQQAVEKTFNGKHPCSLCQKISRERQKETKNFPSFGKTDQISKVFLKPPINEENLFLSKPFFYPNRQACYYCGPVIEPPTPYL